ncbi:hypothetical protein, partial [Pseudomonas viridiflava]|uniref:hypothetical protein n=1 Tax=Pseudomonas viridiflava TaxID=33069 RepID=UPI00198159B6
ITTFTIPFSRYAIRLALCHLRAVGLGSAPLFEFGRCQQLLDRLNRLKNPFTMPGKIVLMPLLDLGQPLAYVKIETLGVLNTQHRTAKVINP